MLLFLMMDSGMCTNPTLSLLNTQKQKNILLRCLGQKSYFVEQIIPPLNVTEIPLPPRDQNIWPPIICHGHVNVPYYKEHILYLSSTKAKQRDTRNLASS